MAAFEAEVPGQAAAARIEHIGLDAERRQHLAVGVEAEVGVLVALHLDQRLPRCARPRCAGLLLGPRPPPPPPPPHFSRWAARDRSSAACGRRISASERTAALGLGDQGHAGGGSVTSDFEGSDATELAARRWAPRRPARVSAWPGSRVMTRLA